MKANPVPGNREGFWSHVGDYPPANFASNSKSFEEIQDGDGDRAADLMSS
jgi:hypothetical protein